MDKMKEKKDATGSTKEKAQKLQPRKERHCKHCDLWFHHGDFGRHQANYHLPEKITELYAKIRKLQSEMNEYKKATLFAVRFVPELKTISKLISSEIEAEQQERYRDDY